MSAVKFPDGFLWGSATASHQVEGGNDNNDWWDWEQQEGRIYDRTRSGDAADWWAGKAEEDLAWAAETGQNAHRLSVEWSRLEPRPGEYDEAAFARYAEILEFARARGLQTMVTLHHFTLPRWAAEKGSWLWDGLAERLGSFSEEVARRLGDRVDLWCTINEPNVLAVAAYGSDRFPPGAKSLLGAFKAMRNLLRGHLAAYQAVHRVLPDARVGLVLNMPFFEAEGGGFLDRFAANFQDRAFNEVFVEAMASGRLIQPLAALPAEVPGLKGSTDFMGLNFYGRMGVRFSLNSPTPLGRHVQQPTIRTEWNDWGQPSPRGFKAQLLRLARLGVPLYVTENGIYDNTDELRPRFIVDHLRAVAEAIAEGAPVKGYFHWSLVDNFEWAEGWATHFGLLALDRATQARTPRRSADLYARICRANAIPDDLEV